MTRNSAWTAAWSSYRTADDMDRDWLLILGALLVILLAIAIVAVCSTSLLTAPAAIPPEPEELVGTA